MIVSTMVIMVETMVETMVDGGDNGGDSDGGDDGRWWRGLRWRILETMMVDSGEDYDGG